MNNNFINNETTEKLRQNTNLYDIICKETDDFLSKAVEYYIPNELTLEMTEDILELLKRGGCLLSNNPPKYMYGMKIKLIHKDLKQINIRKDGELIWLRLY